MGESLASRGPDGGGVWISKDRRVGLVHRRLAILDLSEAGAQPMWRPGAGEVIVHNGEVYNHESLRALPHLRHVRFRGSSDSETILHLLAAMGEGAVPLWEGMFATAFWDDGRRRLILARDRFGKKPLYYFERDGEFLFASQPRALLATPAVSADLDPQAAADFLSYGYVPGDQSIFKGIRKLPPGHVLVREEERSRVVRYWTLDSPSTACADAAGLRRQLETSVSSHMLSDVPVGTFLSGGLDSGSVTAIAARISRSPIDTFTIAYPEGGRS
jgi:asparagine synthase (glutamine-hydrolysing)